MPKPATRPDSTPVPDSIPVSELESKRSMLVSARDQLRLQLNGVENQIYILDQLLNPQPKPESTPAPEPSPEPDPSPAPPGTI